MRKKLKFYYKYDGKAWIRIAVSCWIRIRIGANREPNLWSIRFLLILMLPAQVSRALTNMWTTGIRCGPKSRWPFATTCTTQGSRPTSSPTGCTFAGEAVIGSTLIETLVASRGSVQIGQVTKISFHFSQYCSALQLVFNFSVLH